MVQQETEQQQQSPWQTTNQLLMHGTVAPRRSLLKPHPEKLQFAAEYTEPLISTSRAMQAKVLAEKSSSVEQSGRLTPVATKHALEVTSPAAREDSQTPVTARSQSRYKGQASSIQLGLSDNMNLVTTSSSFYAPPSGVERRTPIRHHSSENVIGFDGSTGKGFISTNHSAYCALSSPVTRAISMKNAHPETIVLGCDNPRLVTTNAATYIPPSHAERTTPVSIQHHTLVLGEDATNHFMTESRVCITLS